LRYGIFGDVHGNLEALESVISGMLEDGATTFLCLGDIVGYGADPIACINRVRDLGGGLVAGNHDLAVIGMLDFSRFNPFARQAILWCRDLLGPEHRSFLERPNLVEQVNEDIAIFHATLHMPEQFGYLQTVGDARKSFSFLRTRCGFFGHSHVPVAFTDGGGWVRIVPGTEFNPGQSDRFLINPGSVGQPRDGNPMAAYGILDDETGAIHIRRVGYDVKKTQHKIRKAGLPDIIAERLWLGY